MTVRNSGSEDVPNLAVTVNGFSYRREETDLSDPNRPRFAVNGLPVEIGGFPEARDAAPRGCGTAYVNTWACGPLAPGNERTLRWTVTAVVTGPYEIDYRVAAGLHGKAKAVVAGGGAPEGSFTGVVSDKPDHTPDRARRQDRRHELAERALLPARAALHRQARVLREALVELGALAHREALPRVLPTTRWRRQSSQRPAFMS